MLSPIFATREKVENIVISAFAHATTMLPSASASLGSWDKSSKARYMAKSPEKDKIKDEPGAEDRFLSGVRKALETPPKPFTPKAKKQERPSLKTKK